MPSSTRLVGSGVTAVAPVASTWAEKVVSTPFCVVNENEVGADSQRGRLLTIALPVTSRNSSNGMYVPKYVSGA